MSDLILPLQQSEAFERTCGLMGVEVRRLVNDSASCLVQTRKIPLIGTFNLVSRGPVFDRTEAGHELLNLVRREVNGPLAVNAPNGAHAPGFKLVKGADLAIVDLKRSDVMRARLHQNWRNQLRKAEHSSLRILNQPICGQKHQWFFKAEQAQQKRRKYRSYPPEFILAYAAANKGQARLYTAMLGTEPVAAMLILKHGLMATYQAGVTTEQGRQLCAHNLVLWTIMTDLEKRGVRQLDLGRIDMSDGLKRFKMRAGARIETLSGTFLSIRQTASRRRSLQTSRLKTAARV